MAKNVAPHPEEGMVYACPECNTAGRLRKREGSWNAWNCVGTETYACDECGARFDDLREREAINDTPGGGQPAKYENHLDRMDPDDLPTGTGV